jgi:hypothetical protein
MWFLATNKRYGNNKAANSLQQLQMAHLSLTEFFASQLVLVSGGIFRWTSLSIDSNQP